jgi:hypothetical protein
VSAATLATDDSLDTAGEVAAAEGVSLVTPADDPVTAVELDYGQGRFARVPPELRVFGLVANDWVELAQDASRTRLRARAAQMLLRDRRARLLLTLLPQRVRQLRLVSPRVPWDLPEVRVRLSPAAVITAPP